VPMALGKHLFSFRTQQLSPAAAIILRKRETSTVPNYKEAIRKDGLFHCKRSERHQESHPGPGAAFVFFGEYIFYKMLLLLMLNQPIFRTR
jgi:hypothetical protein